MQRLVSLLPEPASRRIKHICKELESQGGFKETPTIPPHFSWVIGEDFPEESLHTFLREFSSTIEPFSIYATGLGVFPGQSPILHIPIVKTAQLSLIHQQIWHRFQSCGSYLSPLYKPDCWVPYIRLADDNITRASLDTVLRKFAFEEINLKMEINNITLLNLPEGETGAWTFLFKQK